MSEHDDLLDGDPSLPERDVLESWMVPPPAADFTDRIMEHVDTHLAAARPVASVVPPRRGGLRWAVVGVGMVAAAALVLGLVQLGGSGPAASLEPTVPVAAPSPAATLAVVPRAVPVGQVVVETTPSDSTLLVDGAAVSGSSPYLVSGLSAGSHRLEVMREGYLTSEHSVQGGADHRLSVSLSRRDVVLLLVVDPPLAQVQLRARDQVVDIGHDGSRHALRREPGMRYRIEASAPGYLSRTVELPPTAEPDQTVRLILAPDPDQALPAKAPAAGSRRPSGLPSADSRSPDLDDPFASRYPSSSGEKKDPFAGRDPSSPTTAGDVLDPFLPKAKPGKSKPAKAKPGKLRIGTKPGAAPARIRVDGKLVGTTPLMNVSVTPGRHEVQWHWPDGRTSMRMVTVREGETRVLKAE